MLRVDLVRLIEDRLAEPKPVRRRPSTEPLWEALRRQLEGYEDGKEHNWVSVSTIGDCARKLAYRRVEQPKERVIDGRGKRVFTHGNMAEWWLCALLDVALEDSEIPLRLTDWNPQRKATLEFVLEGQGLFEVNGFADGIIEHRASTPGEITGWPGYWEPVAVLECKSVNQWAFGDYEQDGLTEKEGYWWQCQAAMAAYQVEQCYFLAECKNSQALWGDWIDYEPQAVERMRQHLIRCLQSPSEAKTQLCEGSTLHEGPIEHYQRNGKGFRKGEVKPTSGELPWQCRYCDFMRACWVGARGKQIEEIVVRGQGGPRKTVVVRNPQ